MNSLKVNSSRWLRNDILSMKCMNIILCQLVQRRSVGYEKGWQTIINKNQDILYRRIELIWIFEIDMFCKDLKMTNTRVEEKKQYGFPSCWN